MDTHSTTKTPAKLLPKELIQLIQKRDYEFAAHGYFSYPVQEVVTDLAARLQRCEEALREIAEGRGRYSRDNYEFACNTIADMKALAQAALQEGKS